MTLSFQITQPALQPLFDVHEALDGPPAAIIHVTPSRDRLLFRLTDGAGVFAETALYLGTYQGKDSGAFDLHLLRRALRQPPAPTYEVRRAHLDAAGGTLTVKTDGAFHQAPLAHTHRGNQPPAAVAVETLAAFDTKALRQTLNNLLPACTRNDREPGYRQIGFEPQGRRLFLTALSPTLALRAPLAPQASTIETPLGIPEALARAYAAAPATGAVTYVSRYHDTGAGHAWITLHTDHARFTAEQAQAPLPRHTLFSDGPGACPDPVACCIFAPLDLLDLLPVFDAQAPLALAFDTSHLTLRQELPGGSRSETAIKLAKPRQSGAGAVSNVQPAALQDLLAAFAAARHTLLRVYHLRQAARPLPVLAFADARRAGVIRGLIACPDAD